MIGVSRGDGAGWPCRRAGRPDGVPVTIGRIVHTAPDGTITHRALPEPVTLQVGTRLELTLP